MYRQIAVVQHSQKEKNTELWYGRDGQGRPLRVQGEDKGQTGAEGVKTSQGDLCLAEGEGGSGQ